MAKHTQKQSACDPLDPLTLIQNYDLIRAVPDDACRIALLVDWRTEVARLMAHQPDLRATALHPNFQAVLDEVKH